MITISFNQYAWTDGLIDIPIKVLINNILILFTIIPNTHMTDVLIKEVLTDSPLLIIKKNINCGNFLNKDRFNYRFPTDFPITTVDERLHGEALFHIFSQNEIYNNTSNHPDIDKLHHGYSYTTTQQIPLHSKSTKVYRKKFVLLYML